MPLWLGIEVLPSLRGTAPFRAVFIGPAQKTKFEIAGFRWDFDGDGNWDTQTSTAPQEYVFQKPGDYRIQLQVLDEKGNFQICSALVKVIP